MWSDPCGTCRDGSIDLKQIVDDSTLSEKSVGAEHHHNQYSDELKSDIAHLAIEFGDSLVSSWSEIPRSTIIYWREKAEREQSDALQRLLSSHSSALSMSSASSCSSSSSSIPAADCHGTHRPFSRPCHPSASSQQEQLDGRPWSTRHPHTALTQQQEQDLVDFIVDCNKKYEAVSISDLRKRAIAVASSSHPSFVASTTWLYGFLHRHQLTFHHPEIISYLSPTASPSSDPATNAINMVKSFLKAVWSRRKQLSLSPSQIINIDETHLPYDSRQRRTIAPRGAADVRIISKKKERDGATFAAAVSADGLLLMPMLIFKGQQRENDEKRLRRMQLWPNPTDHPTQPIFISFTPSGYANESVYSDYLRALSARGLPQQTLIVHDSFKGHLTTTVNNTMDELDLMRETIPPTLTGLLQPLDVSVWRRLKSVITKLCQAHLSAVSSETFFRAAEWRQLLLGTTTLPRLPVPRALSRCIVSLLSAVMRRVDWVRRAYYEHLTADSIRDGFRCSGITAAFDGTDDANVHVSIATTRVDLLDVRNSLPITRSSSPPASSRSESISARTTNRKRIASDPLDCPYEPSCKKQFATERGVNQHVRKSHPDL
jgi:hypothetical protein